MSTAKVTEGEAPFKVGSETYKTWYKVVGDLTSKRPLVTLHGGPGAAHNYLLSLADLAPKSGIPVVFYDQLGTGLSTHLTDKNGDTSFWTVQLFLDELDNLTKHLGIQDDYAVLGHSWGGMLGSEHAVTQPKGLKKLIISDSPADMGLWIKAANGLRKQLPQDVQDILDKHERDETYDDPEYLAAMDVFYERHVCRLKPQPQDVQDSFAWLEKDPTVYRTMNGPSEFHVIGSLKTWSVIDRLPKVTVPTLLLNGHYDEATDDTMRPFFDAISQVKWFTFAESSHMPQWEERDNYVGKVSSFLESA